ncbi:hypothetical protein [Mycobacterium sp. JS623]|uniref:hypothetical protein n=1 Tax=Mycobacterium sp. JS623 TaxID=212767 RepID=UPI0012F8B021|nr:hypothetical protein [Mycobacterium sp. JS623]
MTRAVFGVVFATPDPTITVKATLPQTFLEIAAKAGAGCRGRLTRGLRPGKSAHQRGQSL